MQSICIPIPVMEPEQVVEIVVTIDGEARRFNYRVETYDWVNDRPADEMFDGLRQFIKAYDPTWQLVEISKPTSTLVSLMFRQRKGE